MKRPNILIFMTDHQRADTVLPEHPARTPHLEAFAREGLTFTEAHCPAPHCCPSRATFMTGLYPSRHGVWNNVCNEQALNKGLAPGVRSWSEDLQDAGYSLHYTGKWHVSAEETPKDRGWTEHGVTSTGATHMGHTWDEYRVLAAQHRDEPRRAGEICRPGYPPSRLYGVDDRGNPHDERVVTEALEVLRGLQHETEPWCLYAGAIGPHDPYIVPQRYLDLYDPLAALLPPSFHDSLADKPRIYQRMREQIFGQLSPDETREAVRHFWAYCSYLDDLFGRLLAGLEATGQQNDTLVVYCADHGDYCGDHGLFAKGIPCFSGAYRVPVVMRWPAGIRDPGRRVASFVSLADFAPTFQELAGREPDPALTGSSLVPFLQGREPEGWRDELHTQCNGVELYYTQRSVKTAEFKYVFNGFDQDELYDLQTDPHELRNVADDPHYEAVKRDLCRRMWRFARQEQDGANHAYITVGLAPYGPLEAFAEEAESVPATEP